MFMGGGGAINPEPDRQGVMQARATSFRLRAR